MFHTSTPDAILLERVCSVSASGLPAGVQVRYTTWTEHISQTHSLLFSMLRWPLYSLHTQRTHAKTVTIQISSLYSMMNYCNLLATDWTIGR